MTFKRLSEYFQLLENNASRLKITEILADLFKECSVDEISIVCYLSQGKLLPSYEGLEFQMAEKMMLRAVARGVGVGEEEVRSEYRTMGDLGTAASQLIVESGKLTVSVKNSKLFDNEKRDLTVLEVYQRLMEIAVDSGANSVERKIAKMGTLIEDVDSISTRYLVRIPLGKMRMGFSDLTILDALSWMITGGKSLREELEKAYEVVADVGKIAQIVKGVKGINGVKGIKPEVGIPIIPALCQRIGTVEEIINKLGEVEVEPKYDGERLQLHLQRGTTDYGLQQDEKNTVDGRLKAVDVVKIFSRSCENITAMFPDLARAVKSEIKAESVIFDGEGVGLNLKTGKYIAFQEVMTRKRKHDIEEKLKDFKFKYFVFDILLKDGMNLMDHSLEERRKILEKTINDDGLNNDQTIVLSPRIVTDNATELRKYHDEQIKNGLEGVVIKKLQSVYDPGRRGFNWVKLKQETTKKGGGLVDTIDAVVMGVYRGKGKRTDFGVGAFLVGVLVGGNDRKILSLTKIGTGLTDEQFRELKVRSEKLKVDNKPLEYDVDKNMIPDVWCRPGLVVEIQADNVTKSSIHKTGFSLRFPRLIKYRDDKNVEQATKLNELIRIFKLQGQ